MNSRPALEIQKEKVDAAVQGIPVFRPLLGEEELTALKELFATAWLGPGPQTVAFEEAFAEFVDAPYAVAVNSCTAALHLACEAQGLQPGDEVLVPSLTFVSSAHAAAYCGARVVFVDVDPETGNLDPDDLRSRITPRCKGIIPIHYGGHPCDMQALWEIAEEHGLWIIEDAAHACGALYRGRRVGGLDPSLATCFSFNAVKNLNTGDGGMITTHSAEMADRLRKMRWLGIEKSTYERSAGSSRRNPAARAGRYQWYYEVEELGFKYHMNDINATLGLVQLAKLEARQQRRQQMAERYRRALAPLDWLELPQEMEYAQSAWHLYAIRTAHREELKAALGEEGIASSVHYLPLHLQPFYQEAGQPRLPVVEDLWQRLLSIPFHPDLTDEEVGRVIEAVRRFGDRIQSFTQRRKDAKDAD